MEYTLPRIPSVYSAALGLHDNSFNTTLNVFIVDRTLQYAYEIIFINSCHEATVYKYQLQ